MSVQLFAALRARLTLLVLVAILPAMGLALYSGLEQRRAAALNVQANALQVARLAAADQARQINGAHQLLTALAQLPQVRALDEAFCAAMLQDILEEYPFYASIGLLTRDGEWVCRAPTQNLPAPVANRPWLQSALQTRDFVVGDYELISAEGSGGQAVIYLAYPIMGESGPVLGVMAVALDLAWVNQLAAQAELPEGATLTVWDTQGIILARYPDAEQWVGQSAPEAPIVQAILAQQGEGAARSYGLDGVPRLYAFVPLSAVSSSGGEYVALGIPESVAFADVDRSLTRHLIGLGACGLASLGVAWMMGELFVLRQTRLLLRATQRLAAGDLTARTGVKDREGELGQLAQTFDGMAEALQAEQTKTRRLLTEVQRLAITDELTGLHNRRHFFELAEREFQRVQRFGHPLSAVMLDIDHFKQVNDAYGHFAGDQALREVAGRCAQNVRAIDILGRYGGEEFALLLPETDWVAAQHMAERLARCVADTPIATDRAALSITISAGVAAASPDTPDLLTLLNAADMALSAAKRAGRNRVVVSGAPVSEM
jgi:diguanylate cyclase (GGDEF)-like protein